jgi:hypothetical protein
MAVRRRVTRRAPVVRRRRRSMGAAFTKASTKAAAMTVAQGAIGGVAASFLTKMLSGTSTSANLAPYVGCTIWQFQPKTKCCMWPINLASLP